ncbi:MAG: hypothetical protein M1819_003934 [Sarea resinae]|nr:MAG: hypothetical protein M1819_003934 [Sarea resinae]
MLPYGAQKLSKHDLGPYQPMFALYLDIQKGLFFEDLDEREVRGRWKAFVGKWNRGELAEGWYDPATKQKAMSTPTMEQAEPASHRHRRPSPSYERAGAKDGDDNDSEDDLVGPPLPASERHGTAGGRRQGVAIPSMQDLELRRESDQEAALSRREDIRQSRALDRKQQKEALDELVPRAEAGTRERALEKKKEANEKMRAFRDKSPGGAVEEVGDAELMGADDGGIEAFKAKKKETERKKSERELRKEEILRARAAEREERLQIHREKEDKTVAMLKALAKQNFG